MRYVLSIIGKAIYIVPISTIGSRAVLGSKSQYVCVYCQPAPNNNKVIAGQPIVKFVLFFRGTWRWVARIPTNFAYVDTLH